MSEERESKRCFVICPIGEDGSPARERSNEVLKYIITPAVTECGYERPVRGDEIDKTGDITSRVIQHVDDDDLVIADLTGHNPNVFYELAIRHAVHKPVILIIAIGEAIPFDIAQNRVIYFDYQKPSGVEKCKRDIINQIRAIEEDPTDIDSPISNAIKIQFLRRSDDPQKESFGKILEMLEDIRSKLKPIPRIPDLTYIPPLTDEARESIVELIEADRQLFADVLRLAMDHIAANDTGSLSIE